MMYCNHCGKQVDHDAQYCPFCGAGKAEYEMRTKQTTTIDSKAVAFEDEAQRVKDQLATKRTVRLEDFQADSYKESDVDPFIEDDHYTNEMKKLYGNPSKKPKIKSIVIALILLLVVGTCSYFFILPIFRPKTPLDKLIIAIEKQDQPALSSILKTDDSGSIIKEHTLDPFFELLKNDDYRTVLIDALKSDQPNDIVTIENGDLTTFSLRKYPIILKSNLPEASLSGSMLSTPQQAINGEIKTTSLLAGQYHFLLSHSPVYGITSNNRDVNITLSFYSKKMNKNRYMDEIKENIVYVSLPKSDEDALIYVNGKPTNLTVKDTLDLPTGFGPILKGSSITLEKKTDLGMLSSAPVVVESQYEPLVFNFDSSTQGGSNDHANMSNNNTTTDPNSSTNQSNDHSSSDQKSTNKSPDANQTHGSVSPANPSTNHNNNGSSNPEKNNPEKPKDTIPSNWGYSLQSLQDAKKGIVSEEIKKDLIHAIKTYFKEDVIAAKTQSMSPYTNLVNPQRQRNADWVADLKAKQLKIMYDPTKLLIWNNSFKIEEKSGTWYASVSDTYYAHYQVFLKGKMVEDSNATDRWIHMLKYDATSHKWVIYKIEVPSSNTPSNVQSISLS